MSQGSIGGSGGRAGEGLAKGGPKETEEVVGAGGRGVLSRWEGD